MESQRETRTNDAGEMLEGSQKVKVADEAVAEEGKDVVGVEADAVINPMDHSSMEWTAKTSNNASTQAICNRWEAKENTTSPRSAHRPTRKDTVTSTSLVGMWRKRKLVTAAMKKKRTKSLPKIPSQRK